MQYMLVHEEISVVENGALAENLVTQANVINITDVMAEEPEETIQKQIIMMKMVEE